MAEQPQQQEQQQQAPAPQRSAEDVAFEKLTGISLDEGDAGEQPQGQPDVEGEEQGEEQLLNLEEGTGGDSEEQQQREELEEWEFESHKINLPKTVIQALKEGTLRQADYTQKTQHISEVGRQVQAREDMVRMQAQFQSEAMPDIALVKGLETQIKQFDQVNWAALSMEDHVRTKHALDQLKEQRQEAVQRLSEKGQAFKEAFIQKRREFLQKGFAELPNKIKGFKPEFIPQIRQYAEQTGFQPYELDAITNPLIVAVLWKAMEFDKLQSAAPDVRRAATKPAPIRRPGASQQQANTGAVLNKALKAAKDPRQKLRIGEAILGRKLGIG